MDIKLRQDGNLWADIDYMIFKLSNLSIGDFTEWAIESGYIRTRNELIERLEKRKNDLSKKVNKNSN